MNNFITSQIRTYTPIVVGYLLTLLATRFEIVVDENTQTQLVLGLGALVTAVYYSVVRYIERRYPQFGVLLGSKAQPVYKDPETTSKKELK